MLRKINKLKNRLSNNFAVKNLGLFSKRLDEKYYFTNKIFFTEVVIYPR